MDVNQLEIVIAVVGFIGGIFGVGIAIGIYKNKIAALLVELSTLQISINTITQKHDNYVNDYEERIDRLKADIDNEIKTTKTSLDLDIKELSKSIKDIEKVCSGRGSWVEMIPAINNRIKDIEVRVGSLPYQLSEELSKTFANEYKNIVAILKNGKN